MRGKTNSLLTKKEWNALALKAKGMYDEMEAEIRNILALLCHYKKQKEIPVVIVKDTVALRPDDHFGFAKTTLVEPPFITFYLLPLFMIAVRSKTLFWTMIAHEFLHAYDFNTTHVTNIPREHNECNRRAVELLKEVGLWKELQKAGLLKGNGYQRTVELLKKVGMWRDEKE